MFKDVGKAERKHQQTTKTKYSLNFILNGVFRHLFVVNWHKKCKKLKKVKIVEAWVSL